MTFTQCLFLAACDVFVGVSLFSWAIVGGQAKKGVVIAVSHNYTVTDLST